MPQAAEAAVKRAIPRKVELRRPCMSASVPADMMSDRHAEAVRGDHPLQARLAHLEVRLDGGQRDVHDQRVEKDHEEAEARGREGEALRPGHRALKSFSQTRFPAGAVPFRDVTFNSLIDFLASPHISPANVLAPGTLPCRPCLNCIPGFKTFKPFNRFAPFKTFLNSGDGVNIRPTEITGSRLPLR